MRVASPQGTMVLERRGGRACFAEVKEESYSPLAACRTGDMEQNRPARPGAITLNSASKVRNEPNAAYSQPRMAPIPRGMDTPVR